MFKESIRNEETEKWKRTRKKTRKTENQRKKGQKLHEATKPKKRTILFPP
jgi:hypothetical protein